MEEVYVIFDGPPSHEGPRFIEVEDADGKSIGGIQWERMPNGWWRLGPLLKRADPDRVT